MVISYVSRLNRVKVFISTKAYGNMDFKYSLKEEVLKNREKFFEDINIPINRIFFFRPNHSFKIEEVKKPLDPLEEISCDGMFNFYHQTGIACPFGDCLPVIIYEERFRQIVGLIHAGRKNLKILEKAIKYLLDRNIRPNHINVLIGPSIRKESYLLDKEIIEKQLNEERDEFLKACLKKGLEEKNGLISLDLIKSAEMIFKSLEIPPENIKNLPFDTALNSFFFSHYKAARNQEKEGRFLVVAYLSI